MKKFVFVTLTLFGLNVSYAQGGSNIKYKPVNQIDSSDIGRELKIHVYSISKPGSHNNGDTIKLEHGGKEIILVQRSKRGVDYWYFEEQSLEFLSLNNDQFVLLENFRLLERLPGKLKFKVDINFYDKHDHKKLLKTEPETIWFEDKEIAGIYIKL